MRRFSTLTKTTSQTAFHAITLTDKTYLTVPDGKTLYIAEYTVDDNGRVDITGLKRCKGIKGLRL
jgi:hypothetical protein